MSAIAQRLKIMYDKGTVNLTKLQLAVTKGMITQAEYELIIAE